MLTPASSPLQARSVHATRSMATVSDMEAGRVNLGSALEGELERGTGQARADAPPPFVPRTPCGLRRTPQGLPSVRQRRGIAQAWQRSISGRDVGRASGHAAGLPFMLAVMLACLHPRTPSGSPTPADGGPDRLMQSLRSQPIALVGRTTCAYSLEAAALLARTAAPLGGDNAVASFW